MQYLPNMYVKIMLTLQTDQTHLNEIRQKLVSTSIEDVFAIYHIIVQPLIDPKDDLLRMDAYILATSILSLPHFLMSDYD